MIKNVLIAIIGYSEIITDLIFNRNHGDETSIKTLFIVILKVLFFLLVLSSVIWIVLIL